jgi:hypothetical protein
MLLPLRNCPALNSLFSERSAAQFVEKIARHGYRVPQSCSASRLTEMAKLYSRIKFPVQRAYGNAVNRNAVQLVRLTATQSSLGLYSLHIW